MPRARSQNGTATLEGGEESLFFMGGGNSTMGSLKGGHPYKQGNKPATQGGGYDDDADDATDQPAFDDSDSDDDSASMDDSGDDDSEGYDDGDDDSGAEMDDGSGDDDEAMGGRSSVKRTASRKASTKRASTKRASTRASTKKASDTYNLEGRNGREVVRLKEQLAEMQFKLYERDVRSQATRLTERLGDAAPSRAFVQAFERFMLDDGYRLSENTRAAVLKLCDLALKRGVVDLRRLGSGRDIERRTTTARNQGNSGGPRALPVDGDELVEQAEHLALSDGKLKAGRKFAELPTAEKDYFMGEAYRLLSED